MPKTAFRLLIVCLLAGEGASAACVSRSLPALPPRATYPAPRLGLDWSVFVLPSQSPLAFLDEQHFSVADALQVNPVFGFSDPQRPDPGWRLLAYVAALVATLFASLGVIPGLHRFRVRMRSLHLPLPVH